MEKQTETSISRRSIASLIIIYVVFGLAQASNEFRALFLQTQGLSATECGRVLAAASLLSLIGGPVASALADKLRSRRIVYTVSTILWIIIIAALLLTRNFRIAGFALCAGIVPLFSICDSVTYNMIEASGVNASILVPKLDFSIIRVALSIGYCLINFAYTPLVSLFGPEMPFLCTGVLAIILFILSGTMKTFETRRLPIQEERKSDLGLSRLFKSYYLVTFLILTLILSFGGASGSFLVYLMNELGMDTAFVGIASGIRVAGEILVMISLPFLKRKLSIPLLLAISTLMSILQMVIYLTCTSHFIILAALALGGGAGGITLGSCAMYLRRLAPEGLDTLTLTLNSSMRSVGSIIMSVVGGIIIDSSGIYGFYRISLLFMAAWVILYFASWAFGKYLLKIEPPVAMFRR